MWWLAVEREDEVSCLNWGDPPGVETPGGSQSFHSSIIILAQKLGDVKGNRKVDR